MTTYRLQLAKPLRHVHPYDAVTEATFHAPHSAGDGPAPSAADTSEPRKSAAATTGAGPATATAAVTQALERLAAEILELEGKRREGLRELQAVAVELSVCLAERLLHTALQDGRHSVTALLQAALDDCGEQRPLAIRLHPQDLAQLQQTLSETGGLGSYAAEGIALKADPHLERGCCESELDEYRRRFDWPHQLQELRQALLNELDHAQIERRTSQATNHGLQRVPERRETA